MDFTTILIALVIVCCILQAIIYYKPKEDGHKTSQLNSRDEALFKQFQRTYLTIYLLSMAADWLQGPYVYALYESYGFNKQDIAFLFVSGFLSSMVFGIIVGPIADKYGRKLMTIVFGVLYSIGCITKLIPDFNILLLGRIFGGISTSLLFSVFESWMVAEHNKRGFPEHYISSTFYLASLFNGIVAIVAGIWSSFVAERWGFVAPFMWALGLLILATILVMTSWSENFGNSSLSLELTFTDSIAQLRSDPSMIKLGMIQSLFEASMYTFVFMWTPTLQEGIAATTAAAGGSVGELDPLPFGNIFATFMVCIMIGSSLFKLLSMPADKLIHFIFIVSIVTMCVPFLFISPFLIYSSFLVFEICCGMYFPCIGTLRSKYIPESARASILNYFRVPLNLMVVIVLSNISSISTHSIFKVCSLWLAVALFLLLSMQPPKPTILTASGSRQV